jgi:O-acetyl-ADP-ribose deacetylase (regulator of RNase III)
MIYTMVTFVFFDKDEELIEEYMHVIKSSKVKTSFIVDDIESLLRKYKFDAIISPANSFGCMSGGIDRTYRSIFPNIERKLILHINQLKLARSNIGYYVPVGNNVIVGTGHRRCDYMIAAPTMFSPRVITGTYNVYLAFYGILQKYYHRDMVIGCPGLGTGIGGLSNADSAIQIMKAIDDYSYNNPTMK